MKLKSTYVFIALAGLFIAPAAMAQSAPPRDFSNAPDFVKQRFQNMTPEQRAQLPAARPAGVTPGQRPAGVGGQRPEGVGGQRPAGVGGQRPEGVGGQRPAGVGGRPPG